MVLAHTTYCVSVLRCLDLDKGSNTTYCVSVLRCLDIDKGSNTTYCVSVLRCLDLDKGSNHKGCIALFHFSFSILLGYKLFGSKSNREKFKSVCLLLLFSALTLAQLPSWGFR